MCASDKIKTMVRKASDNPYMHKDFHGALCYGIKYLGDNFGQSAVREYLHQVGESYFSPLSDKLKEQGLTAIEEHFTNVMSLEGGECKSGYKDGRLIFEVTNCPAVAHLKKINAFFTEDFCLTTAVVNEAICEKAGYKCSCRYEKGLGRCVQEFWKQ